MILPKIKEQLLATYSQLTSWISEDKREATPPEKSFTELPQQLQESLDNAIKDLPNHPTYLKAVQKALDSSFSNWYNDPANSHNSLAILSSPVEPISLILQNSLETWQNEQQIALKTLAWQNRPEKPENLQSKLLKQLGRGTLAQQENKLEIIIIPDLSYCFLRSVEGLDGIEYFRDTLLKDRSRFWIIGCGKVTWQYLDAVCKIGAYFDEIISLSFLNDEQLQVWLKPIVTAMNIDFTKHEEQSEDDQTTAEKRYFQKLARASNGISSVAVKLFKISLAYEPNELDSETINSLVKVLNPRLPKLPELNPNEHYLLFSVLLHSNLSLPHLAMSLGDDESNVQHLVQVLCRADILKVKDNLLSINPLYYPQLRDELDYNNFLIAEE
ncbi:MAG: hypothetical protein SAK42_21505 [Oscillatoria sp. PMC 1076.18]|nr:hypothetical protein [Oscillatoria sp. PMC 1076.18]